MHKKKLWSLKRFIVFIVISIAPLFPTICIFYLESFLMWYFKDKFAFLWRFWTSIPIKAFKVFLRSWIPKFFLLALTVFIWYDICICSRYIPKSFIWSVSKPGEMKVFLGVLSFLKLLQIFILGSSSINSAIHLLQTYFYSNFKRKVSIYDIIHVLCYFNN